MNGRIYTVDYVDDAGQIHIQESGLAVIPNVDIFVMVDFILQRMEKRT
jgi:hypothetical protein